MRKTIRRKRARVNAPPPDPVTLAQLAIPQQYREYEPQPGQVENFILAESPQGPGKIVILGRARNLDIQERSDRWYVDGTFKIVPLIFGQLFVVLAEEHGAVHPLCIRFASE